MTNRPPRRCDRYGRNLRPSLDSLEERCLLSLQVLPVSAVESLAYANPVATFNRTDIGGDLATLQATINWGNGTSSSGVLAVDPTNTTYTVTGSNTYAASGNYTVGVSVSTSTASLSATGSATVASLPITVSPSTLTGFLGQPISGTLATFTDQYLGLNASAYRADINWNDGTTSTGAITYDSTNKFFTVTGQHQYALAGTYSVGLTVTRLLDQVSTQSIIKTTITSSTLAITPQPVSGIVDQPLAGATLTTFTDTNPTLTPTNYRANISWGDGATAVGTITQDSTSKIFSVAVPAGDTHVFTTAGAPAVVVTITRLTDSASQTVNPGVTIVDPTIVMKSTVVQAQNDIPITATVATFSDPYPNATKDSYTATITWGDGHSTPGIVTGSAGNFIISGTNTYRSPGTYNLSVQVTRTISNTSVTLAGANGSQVVVASSIMSVTPAKLTGVVAQPLAGGSVLATFTDTDPTLTPTNYRANISWGDGSTAVGTITQDSTSKIFSVAVPAGDTHVFTTAGTPAVVVTITRLTDSASQTVNPGVTIVDPPIVINASSVLIQKGTPNTSLTAHFTDAYPGVTAASYQAVIDWGNGVKSPGIIAPDASTGQFTVNGAYAYPTSGPFTVTVTVLRTLTGTSGQVSVSTGTVNAPIPLTSHLDAPTWLSNSYGVAWNNNRPTFVGTAPANSVIRLTAVGGGFIGNAILGQVVADNNGNWRVATGPLPDGNYTFTAMIVQPNYQGQVPVLVPEPQPVSVGGLAGGTLTIDTVAPTVVGVSYNAKNKQVVIQTEDLGSGLNIAGLGDINNFAVVPVHQVGPRSIATVPISSVNIVANDPRIVSTILSLQKAIKPGYFRLMLASMNITDNAGNHLAFPARGMVIPSVARVQASRVSKRARH